MIAERLDLWRLSNFSLRRLPSGAEDVYLFHAVARANQKDERLIAIAEVRDLTAARDSAGEIIGYPMLEGILGQAFADIRSALRGQPQRQRPLRNRVLLYVRPVWDIPTATWRSLAHRMAAQAADLGLEKVAVRIRMPDEATGEPRTAILDVENVADRAVTVRVREPSDQPIQPHTEYQQRALRAKRLGVPYPYELIRMLTPPWARPRISRPATSPSTTSARTEPRTAAGGADELVPVGRPYGRNSAGIVTGVITSYTSLVPEGIRRVAILGDPTEGLGSLAEPECRRILAALALARRMRVPVEWFALSSGAKIAWDSGTENMDWIAAVLRGLVEFTQSGGEVNIVVTGINVGAQPYWDAEATMLMHTRGILIMTPASAMVLTGKKSLDYSGGVSAEDNFGIGGFERIMGPNGQAQYWAPTLAAACALLLRHYAHTYIVPGERHPRRAPTDDPSERDVRAFPHKQVEGSEFATVGDVFSAELNGDRKKPFDMRSVMRAVSDADDVPFERWAHWHNAEGAIVWEARVGGFPVCLIGLESRNVARAGFVPADGPLVVDIGDAVPAVVAQGRPRHQRGQRQPAGCRAGQSQRLRRLTGEHAQVAAGVRRGDRPRGDELPRAHRLRGGLALPRWRVRGLLQAAARRHGDGRGGRLLRFGDRRGARRRRRSLPSGVGQDRRGSPGHEPADAAHDRDRQGARGWPPSAGRGHPGRQGREAEAGRRRVRRHPRHPARDARRVRRPDHRSGAATAVHHQRPGTPGCRPGSHPKCPSCARGADPELADRPVDPAVRRQHGVDRRRFLEPGGRRPAGRPAGGHQERTAPPPPAGEDLALGGPNPERGPGALRRAQLGHRHLDRTGVPAQPGLQHLERAFLGRPDEVGRHVPGRARRCPPAAAPLPSGNRGRRRRCAARRSQHHSRPRPRGPLPGRRHTPRGR